MKPLPWSFSSLDTFRTCPRKYEAENVTKSVPRRPPGAAQEYGIRVHKAFEEHQLSGVELPADLRVHQRYMDKLRDARDGAPLVERRVGLNLKLQPCDFFAPDVWWRGVIDYDADTGHDVRQVVDYKTGKQKNDFTQLHCFAIFKFMEGAKRVKTEFYWTQTQTTSVQTFDRMHLKQLLAGLEPDLRQMREAFRSDIWQPRQNGLCRNYCDVKDCEFWGCGR